MVSTRLKSNLESNIITILSPKSGVKIMISHFETSIPLEHVEHEEQINADAVRFSGLMLGGENTKL